MQTALQEKVKEWKKFASLAEEKILTGGEKYALSPDKEATDILCEILPGRTGIDSLLGEILRYTIRFLNLGREDDLVKIAAHAGMAWAKKFGSKDRNLDNPKPRRRRSQNKKAETTGAETSGESSEGEVNG